MQELDEKIRPQIESLKKEVRNMIVSKIENPFAKVHLIDSICRLGVNYHFQHEIDEALLHFHENCVENGDLIIEDNLHTISVLFRLLRQQGFRVSPSIFLNSSISIFINYYYSFLKHIFFLLLSSFQIDC